MTGQSSAHLRRFGLTVGAGLAILGVLSWYRGHATAPPVLWAIGGTLSVLGLTVPNLLLPVEKAWMALALVLGWINTRIILSLLFYVVFTPIGVVMRFFRDPLNRRFRDQDAGYWIHRETARLDLEAYKRQF
jgi:saxitoxin biosynthesis operon SxtJ-like protein